MRRFLSSPALGSYHYRARATVVQRSLPRRGVCYAEWEHLTLLRAPEVRAKVHIWSLSQIVAAPELRLRNILNAIGPQAKTPHSAPPIDLHLTAFKAFVHALENQGLHPTLARYIAGSEVLHKEH